MYVLYLLAAEMILCPQIHKLISESVYLIQVWQILLFHCLNKQKMIKSLEHHDAILWDNFTFPSHIITRKINKIKTEQRN